MRRTYTYLPADLNSNNDIDRTAIYGEVNSDLGEGWGLTLGIRGEKFSATYVDSNSVYFRPEENLYGGKMALTYQTSDGSLLYASVSKGYKTGGFNTYGSLDKALREVDTEGLLN